MRHRGYTRSQLLTTVMIVLHCGHLTISLGWLSIAANKRKVNSHLN